DKHAAYTDKSNGPKRRGLGEANGNGVVVDFLNLDVLVASDRDGRRRRIGGVLPIEDTVIGREGFAVVPSNVALELPGDGKPARRGAAVLAARNLRRQDGYQLPIAVPCGKRLIENARPFLIFCAHRKMRIKQRRALPPQHLQGAATTPLGRFVSERALRSCH